MLGTVVKFTGLIVKAGLLAIGGGIIASEAKETGKEFVVEATKVKNACVNKMAGDEE